MLHTECNYERLTSLCDNTHGRSAFINNTTDVTRLLLPFLIQKYKQLLGLRLKLAMSNPRLPLSFLDQYIKANYVSVWKTVTWQNTYLDQKMSLKTIHVRFSLLPTQCTHLMSFRDLAHLRGFIPAFWGHLSVTSLKSVGDGIARLVSDGPRAGRPGFNSWERQWLFLSPTHPGQGLGTTQLPTQWVAGTLSPRVKRPESYWSKIHYPMLQYDSRQYG
jgi:hypothetical protein